MAVPKGTPLDNLITSMQLTAPASADGWSKFEIVSERGRSNAEKFWFERPIVAWYPTSGEATPEGLCQRISKELVQRRHPVSNAIVRAIVGLLCIRSAKFSDGVDALNALFEVTDSTECIDHFLAGFPPHPDFEGYTLGDFAVGRLDREKLIYLCRRVQCNFFERNPDAFKGVFSIQRARAEAQVISAARFPEILRPVQSAESIEHKIIDAYYEAVAANRLDGLRRDFMESQSVPAAAGVPVLDATDPHFWINSSFVCVFTWRTPQLVGYFCPLGQYAKLDFGHADEKMRAKLTFLKEQYQFTQLTASDLHRLIGTFSRFVMLARLRSDREQYAEGFLNYVIALDLVFGEKDASNQAISTRVGVITAPKLGVPFDSARERMKQIYGLRSQFVHRGKPVGQDAVELVRPLIEAVFDCFMLLQSRPSGHEQGFPEAWLKQLDFIAAGYDAGIAVERAVLEAAGLG
jgi:hypothetical protein